jgi:hypothetical protein
MSDTAGTTAQQQISVSTVLFNPSYYLAGGWSLCIGLATILLTGFVGAFAHGHMDGVLDLHFGRSAPLWLHVVEGVVDWLVPAVLLYIAGRILSRSHHLRALDVFGTQAIARFPYLLAMCAGLLPGFQLTVTQLAERARQLRAGEAITPLGVVQPGQDAPFIIFLGVTLFALLMLAWMVALMYRAYTSSCNLKGSRAVVSFIIVLIVAEILAKLGVQALFLLSSS